MSRKKIPEAHTESEIAPLAEPLEAIAERHGLKPAANLPAQIDPPELELEPLPRARHEGPGPHAAAVMASRPYFRPTPEGFTDIANYPFAGVRVSKSLDKRIAAVGFAENLLPSRAEKDALEAISDPDHGRGFSFNVGRRQWERRSMGDAPGENIVDAAQLGASIARDREGRGR